MILIITSKRDGHIGNVIKYFNEHKTYTYEKAIDGHKNKDFEVSSPIEWVRLNIEDAATNLNITINPSTDESTIEVKDSKKIFKIGDIKSIWYRKPDPVNLSHFKMQKEEIEYIEAEMNEVILGLYSLLGEKLWINNPLTSRVSHRKLLQLKVAKDIGFEIPKTLISNNEHEVLAFAESANWDVAIKSLGAISVTKQEGNEGYNQFGIWTRRINKEELLAVRNKIHLMPTLYQKYVKKKFELRVTCVGKEIFGCRINSQENPLTNEDMRFDVRNLKHHPFDCKDIADRLHKYLDYFKLNFGCFDIAVDENDNFVFFECNPNGQWLWIEQLTELKISKAIAELLICNQN